MRKLTNLQMGIIADKIYNDLSNKVKPINEARIAEVDINNDSNTIEIFDILTEREKIKAQIKPLEDKMNQLGKKASILIHGTDRYSSNLQTSEAFLSAARLKKAKLITIDRNAIEANIILSDVTDLDSLIKSITKGIIEDIPELNEN